MEKLKINNKTGERIAVACVGILVVLAVIITIGTTYAWNRQNGTVFNEFQSAQLQVDVIEEFPTQEITWCGATLKKVSFQNTGTVDAFIRVSYADYWLDQNKKYLSNVTEDGQEIAIKNWTKDWEQSWEDGKDGYYYYKKILKVGETTEVILNSVSFRNSYKDLYETTYQAKYHLNFSVDYVQCSSKEIVNREAVKQTFGINYIDIDKKNNTITWLGGDK